MSSKGLSQLPSRSAATRLVAFIRLGRPQFLVGGFLLYGLGVAAALSAGATVNVTALLWGQVAVTSFQLMTHYANEYFDFDADRANTTPTDWSGGSRVLPDGLLPPRVALSAAVVLASAGLAASSILAIAVPTGTLTLPLLLLGFVLSWGYSAPPLKLHSRGVGEALAAFVVPVLTPLVGYSLQAGRLDALPVLVAAPLWFVQFTMFLTIEFPDAAGDRQAGKRTLVVRLGPRLAARVHNVALLAGYAVLPLLVRAGMPAPVALAVLAGVPLAAWRAWQVGRGGWADPRAWNGLAFAAVALLAGTAAAELLAFVALLWTRA